MIEPTDEMVHVFRAALPDEGYRGALAAVLAIVERDLREQIADALEANAGELRGGPFRMGLVGFDLILGIEAAANAVRTGEPVTP